MKHIRHLSMALLPLLLACGCSSMSNTEAGAGAGGLIGAGTGALIGSATGHSGAGALIGAGVGAVSGALVGHAVDESEKKAAVPVAVVPPPPPPTALGVTDVAQMVQSHVTDDVIITQIRATGSVFHLSSTDVIWLKQQGASDAVIQEMLASATRMAPGVYPAVPVYGEPAYVAPPVSVGVGFGYYGRHW
jgi:outer membrane lipoprotein SlyB